jgi:hypothetical protein
MGTNWSPEPWEVHGYDVIAAAVLRDAIPVNDWRPIESAPRDGTDFLALCDFRKTHHQMAGCFAPNGKFVSWPGRWNYQPTHWQPLPATPAMEGRDG